jgi:hypothetical protein
VACGYRVGADMDRLGVVTVDDHRVVGADGPMGDRGEADRLTVHRLGFGIDEVLDRLLLAEPGEAIRPLDEADSGLFEVAPGLCDCGFLLPRPALSFERDLKL